MGACGVDKWISQPMLMVGWDLYNWPKLCYGYYANAAKTWLVIKLDVIMRVDLILVQLLAAPNMWMSLLPRRVKGIETAVCHCCLPTSCCLCCLHPWHDQQVVSYLSRTIPGISCHLQALENIIGSDFIPYLTGRSPPNNVDRKLMGLSARLGGLSITDPSSASEYDFRVSAPLHNLIKTHDHDYSYEALASQMTVKSDIRCEKWELIAQTATSLRGNYQILSSKPWILQAGWHFCRLLNMVSAYTRALLLMLWHYVMAGPPQRPLLSCGCGGFPSLRHNEIRDLTTTLLTEVCSDIQIEPDLQEISTETMTRSTANTAGGAPLDIAANGVWGGRCESVKVFNPFAPSNRQTSLEKCFLKHEKRAYEQRVREIEHVSFVPLAMSATGGMAKEATNF